MRNEVEKGFGLFATDNYGMSELMGPGVSGECVCRDGMHIAEDHFLAEIIDSDSCQVLEPGSTGELVITTLTQRSVSVASLSDKGYFPHQLRAVQMRPHHGKNGQNQGQKR